MGCGGPIASVSFPTKHYKSQHLPAVLTSSRMQADGTRGRVMFLRSSEGTWCVTTTGALCGAVGVLQSI